jgi:hypothetical protein
MKLGSGQMVHGTHLYSSQVGRDPVFLYASIAKSARPNTKHSSSGWGVGSPVRNGFPCKLI